MQEFSFEEAVRGLINGDFSRLAPLFETRAGSPTCQIMRWYEQGVFAEHPEALKEAFTCACFNGCADVVKHLLEKGADPSGGAGTGLNAFHWAANRGQLEVVKLLIRYKAPLETRNMYGGTVLGCAVYSAIHEARPAHTEIIETLLTAGADVREIEFPTGDECLDHILRRHRTA